MNIQRRHENGQPPHVRGMLFARKNWFVALFGFKGEWVVERFRKPLAGEVVMFDLSAGHLLVGGAPPNRSLSSQKHGMPVGRGNEHAVGSGNGTVGVSPEIPKKHRRHEAPHSKQRNQSGNWVNECTNDQGADAHHGHGQHGAEPTGG